jgi:hypothetical protein
VDTLVLSGWTDPNGNRTQNLHLAKPVGSRNTLNLVSTTGIQVSGHQQVRTRLPQSLALL